MTKLYPQWGAGKKPFKKAFKVATLKSIGQQHMSAGDKIVLPEACLKEIKRLRLPFPFLFEIRRGNCTHDWDYETKAIRKAKKTRQFCSALEFSGKDRDLVYLPVWMMRNLKVKSGKFITLRSVFNVPPGEAATLKPETDEFFDVIHSLGPQEFLESKMKHYSVLSQGERILIVHDSRKYYINITKTEPKSAISILGDVDLSIEFETNEEFYEVPQKSDFHVDAKQEEPDFSNEPVEDRPPEILEEYSEDNEDEFGNDFSTEPFCQEESEPEETIDQEDAETRRARVREAAMKRYAALLSTEV